MSEVKVAESCPALFDSMEFSRPEHWSGQPVPTLGDLSNPQIEPRSPTLQADSLPTELSGKPLGVDHNKLWKILKELGIPDHLNLSSEKPVCRSRSNS